MKVGFIVECGPEGAETKVIPHLARELSPGIEIDVVPLDRKPKLKSECGRYVRQLLDLGFDRVLIVWDLLPDWGEYEGKGCQRADREQIYASLRQAGLRRSDRRVSLVCIHKMLEAWLIADGRAVSNVLSRPTHPVRIEDVRTPERVPDPKLFLNRSFREHSGWQYLDRRHAIQIAQALPDFGRLRRVPSFARFCSLLGASAT